MRMSDWSSDVCSSDLPRTRCEASGAKSGCVSLRQVSLHKQRKVARAVTARKLLTPSALSRRMELAVQEDIRHHAVHREHRKKHDHKAVRTEELRHLPQGAQMAGPLQRGARVHRLPRRKAQPGKIGRAHV